MRAIICFGIVLGFVSPGFGQVDAAALRAKYGSPLNKAMFVVRPGIEMVVTYGTNDKVCKLEIPSGVATKEQIDAILDEIVPPSLRVLELGKMFEAMSSVGLSTTQYERVTIKRPFLANRPERLPGVSVEFKDSDCRK